MILCALRPRACGARHHPTACARQRDPPCPEWVDQSRGRANALRKLCSLSWAGTCHLYAWNPSMRVQARPNTRSVLQAHPGVYVCVRAGVRAHMTIKYARMLNAHTGQAAVPPWPAPAQSRSDASKAAHLPSPWNHSSLSHHPSHCDHTCLQNSLPNDPGPQPYPPRPTTVLPPSPHYTCAVHLAPR